MPDNPWTLLRVVVLLYALAWMGVGLYHTVTQAANTLGERCRCRRRRREIDALFHWNRTHPLWKE